MISHTYKFPTKTLATFVSSELTKSGLKVVAASNGYVEVNGNLNESARSLIKDHRGVFVCSTTQTVKEALEVIEESKMFPRFKKGKKLTEGGHQVTETLNKALEKIEGYMKDGLSKREAYRMWSKTSGLAAELKQSVGHQIGLDEIAPPMKKKEGEKEAPAKGGGKGIESAAMVALKAKVESDPKSFPKLAAALGVGADKKGAKKESVRESVELSELHYRKADSTNPTFIPAKWVYDEFFKTLKNKKVFFNQLKAEEALEYEFTRGIGNRKAKGRQMGDLWAAATERYAEMMGITIRESVELSEAGIKDKIMSLLAVAKISSKMKEVIGANNHADKVKKAREVARLIFIMLTRVAALNMTVAHFIEKKKAEEMIFEIIMHISTHASHFSPAHLAHSVSSLVMGYEPEGDVIEEGFRFRQQDWERMRAKYKQGTPVHIVLKNGKVVSGTLLRMDKYDQAGYYAQGHMLHVKTDQGKALVDDVDVKSIQWDNDPKTKMEEGYVAEVAPPSGPGRKIAHKQSAKIAFTKQYGKENGDAIRYGRAWNVYKGKA